MTRRAVALLTDFGTDGHYVGAMKGAMLSVCQEIDFIDITHDIAPADVRAGARHLAAAAPYFPPGTVFLAVVDPGVGSGRRAIAAEAGGLFLVGPDNGVLAETLDELRADLVVTLDNPQFARPTVSNTFEGRDRLGPAAAWIAAGTPLASMGTPVHDYVRLPRQQPTSLPDRLCGLVEWVDHFGNLVTNIHRQVWDAAATGRPALVFVNRIAVGDCVATYCDVGAARACALFGSTGYLEIAVREGHAGHALSAGPGAAVEVVWR
jgi:S-adenosyl-L-methionine hydrolase (adenosine-forming)